MMRTRADIPLGEQSDAEPTFCIVDSDDIREDKRHNELKDPEPKHIAEAIVAFQTNSTRRTRVFWSGSYIS
jgi:hypothetical protein